MHKVCSHHAEACSAPWQSSCHRAHQFLQLVHGGCLLPLTKHAAHVHLQLFSCGNRTLLCVDCSQNKLQRAVDLVVHVLSPTNGSYEPIRVEADGSARLRIAQTSIANSSGALAKPKVSQEATCSMESASTASTQPAGVKCLPAAAVLACNSFCVLRKHPPLAPSTTAAGCSRIPVTLRPCHWPQHACCKDMLLTKPLSHVSSSASKSRTQQLTS